MPKNMSNMTPKKKSLWTNPESHPMLDPSIFRCPEFNKKTFAPLHCLTCQHSYKQYMHISTRHTFSNVSGTEAMDFSTLLKGATDTLKNLDKDVKQASEDTKAGSEWSGWANGEEDWEDVNDVAESTTDSTSKPPEEKSDDHNAQIKDLQERLSDTERKLFAVTRDRDALRRIRDQKAADAELVKEKDQQIKAVLAEGESLSIKIAEKENTMRSLKAQIKEKDTNIDDLRVTLSATEAKLEAAASRQRQLETSEKSAADAVEAAERRLRQVESEARTNSSSSAALEAARAQLESLRKSQAAALENQAMRLSAEQEAAIEAVTKKANLKEEGLNKAMTELRDHLSQVLDNTGWREDQLRKETEELRKRAEQLEARNEELAAALPNATRPLLRQVEALQAAASERVRAKSAIDRSQLERLRAAEAAVATAEQRERSAEERIGGLMTKVAGLEEQVRLGQAEQARLSREIRKMTAADAEIALKHQRELEEAQAKALKVTREREAAQEDLSRERASHLDDTEAAEEREKSLRTRLASLEAKLEMAQESITKMQAGARTSSPRLPRYDSMGNMSSTSIGFGSEFGEDEPGSAGGVYGIERLSQSLRQRNGEITSLQAQLDGKEAATKALAEEVVSLTARVDELTKELGDAPERKKEYDELKRRHTALLELLGEREERIMELEADLQDVNQMYKEQVTELLLRIEKLST